MNTLCLWGGGGRSEKASEKFSPTFSPFEFSPGRWSILRLSFTFTFLFHLLTLSLSLSLLLSMRQINKNSFFPIQWFPLLFFLSLGFPPHHFLCSFPIFYLKMTGKFFIFLLLLRHPCHLFRLLLPHHRHYLHLVKGNTKILYISIYRTRGFLFLFPEYQKTKGTGKRRRRRLNLRRPAFS